LSRFISVGFPSLGRVLRNLGLDAVNSEPVAREGDLTRAGRQLVIVDDGLNIEIFVVDVEEVSISVGLHEAKRVARVVAIKLLLGVRRKCSGK
jgi:hypothetical protein